jgi:acetoacetyl-CoA synthetase
MNTQPLWTPSEATIANSNMLALQHTINKTFGVNLSNYNELHQWSVDNTEAFWKLLSDQHSVLFKTNPEKYL